MTSKFEMLSDDSLAEISGGYLQVSKWREFVSTQIMPVINGLQRSASESDKAIINQISTVLQGTVIPGAEVATPVKNLWSTYNVTYRPRLQGENVKLVLDQTLYSAKRYIEQNA